MSKLAEILDQKRAEVLELQTARPVTRELIRTKVIRDFSEVVKAAGGGIIAEIKRRSPSRGDLFPAADPVEVAVSYENEGACALSVLTDKKYFGGDLEFLRKVRTNTTIPILRKDFIISEYQVWESYHAGADAILLISEAMKWNELERLYALATDIGLHVLVESFTMDSLQGIRRLQPEIAGINARNLSTLEVDFQQMLNKRKFLPNDIIAVAESGITEPEQLDKVFDAGYQAALIGSAFMQTGNPGARLREFLQGANASRGLS